MIKDADVHPYGRDAEGTVCGMGHGDFHVLFVHHSPSTFLCSPTWNLSEHHAFGILWELHHEGMIDH